MDSKLDKLLADLTKQTEETSAKKDKPKVTDKLPNRSNNRELDRFRYLLTLLLVSVKFGIFPYLYPNPLEDVSWFIVFLPAYFIEASLAAFLLLLALVTVVGLVGIRGYFGTKDLIRRFRNKEPSAFPLQSVDKDGW